ncbi:MAG: FecR domain-containing protein [Myxococcota bacterium]|nr:FecR domain-containing protein [Myxococcota bacterium]
MRRGSVECRTVRRDMLRRADIGAVQRARLDVHLKRCPACREIARHFELIEAGANEISYLDKSQKQAIYNRLIPVVNEKTNRSQIRPVARRAPTRWSLGLALGAAGAVAVLAGMLVFPRVMTEPATQPSDGANTTESMALPRVVYKGLIDRHEGTVHVNSDATLGKGHFKVATGTRVSVSKDARFSFRIGSIARVAMFGETQWEITSATDTYVAMNLEAGRVAVDFDGALGKVMEIKTPDTLVRVKGTVFTVEVQPQGKTRVGVLEGRVEVVALSGEPRTVNVASGELVALPGDGSLLLLSDDHRRLAAEMHTALRYPEELTRLVRFDGSPERVKVEVDGRVVGTTPLAVRLPSGPFTYRLTSPGMDPVVGSVSDRADSGKIEFNMAPKVMFEAIPEPNVPVSASKRRGFSRNKASARTSAATQWNLFKRARAAMAAGDIPYAIGLLERALETLNGRRLVNGLSLLAECYAASGQYAKAASTFDRIVEKVPGSTIAQNARYEVGRLSMDQLGDLSRARAAFTAYVASPRGGALREEAYYSLCELDGRESAHRDALHCFNQFLRTFPGGIYEPEARLWRGALHQDMSKSWGDAERDLLAFIQAKPRHPRVDEARYRVVLGRYQSNDRRGAMRMIDEYLRKHPAGQYRVRVQRLKRAVMDPTFSLTSGNK